MTHFTSVLVSTRNWFSVRFFWVLVVFLGLSVSVSWGQTNYVSWDFTPALGSGSYDATQANMDGVRTTSLSNVSFTGITCVGVSSANNSTTLHRSTGWPGSLSTIDATATKYTTFSITLSNGQTFPNSTLSLDLKVGNSSTTTAPVRLLPIYGYGTSPTFASIGSIITINGTQTQLATITIPAPGNTTTTKLTIRIAGYNTAAGTTGNMRLSTVALTGANPPIQQTPTTTLITPASATAGGSGFTLTVNGTNFISGLSTITWGGATRTTTYVNSTQLTASISAADIASAGTAAIGVTTTGAASSSNAQTFTINSASTPSLSVTGTTAHGTICPNSAAVKQTYTITNSGTEATNVVVSSSDAQFVVSNLSSTTIAATNGTATYDVIFTPTSSGAKTATISVYYNTSTLATTSSLTGTGTTSVSQAVTSLSASSVTAQTATLNGNVTTLGVCPATIEKGFVYSVTTTNNNPLVAGTGVTKTSVGSIGTGTFTLALTDLASSTGYSYKSYVYDGTTYSYGTVQTFTTSIALVISGTLNNGSPCINTAASPITYTITNNGAITVEGIALNSSDAQFVTSALSSTTIAAGGTATYLTTFTPTSIGSKSSTVTVSSTTGGIVSATNIPTGTGINTLPTVTTTNPATSITALAATVSGNVTAEGCQTVTGIGICYGTSSSPDITGTKTIETGTTGAFSSNINDLLPNTIYYFRAYATSSAGTSYGSDVTFTTSNLSATVANTASNNSSTGFTANWDALNGASGYRLDVYRTTVLNTTDLFISEYIEGTGTFEKYIEIFNGTGSSIDLSNYKLQLYSNGSATVSNEATLSGILTNGSTIVFKNSSSSLYAGTATVLTSVVNFNGDDAIALYKISTSSYVDIIGKIGNDPGTAWTSTSNSTLDKTLVRKSNISSGITTNPSGTGSTAFTSLESEWTQYNIDVTSNLGSHTFNSVSESFIGIFNDLPASGTSRIITGLSPATTYYYRVRAVGGNSTSVNSNVVSVTTLASYAIAASSSDGVKGSVSGAASYDAGASVSLTASPLSASYRFVNWTENGSFVSKESTYTFTASAARTLVANFADLAAPIAISTTTNASNYAACATCDVTVAAGGQLTIDEAKTFNSVTLAPTAKLTLSDGVTLTAPITLQSSESGTATFVDSRTDETPSAINGTVEQRLPQGRNWYVGLPVSSGSTSTLTAAGLGTSVSYWNEAGSAWVNSYSGSLTPGRGYIAASSSGTGTNNASFTGTLNSGDVTIRLTKKGTSKIGFNLVANPYPSYIDAVALVGGATTNMEQTVWYRTKVSTAYHFPTVNTASGVATDASGAANPVTRLIPPMQSFWVRTNTDDYDLVFTNAIRYHANATVGGNPVTTTPMKVKQTSESMLVRINVSNGINQDQMVIYTDDNANNAYDIYDSRKMMNENANIPDLYSVVGSEKLVINGLKTIVPDTEIELGFVPGKSGSFSINATELKNISSDVYVAIKDKLQNIEFNLTSGQTYEFSSDAMNDTNRFSIIFRSAGTTTGLTGSKLNTSTSVFVNANGELVVKTSAPLSADASVAVYNAIGQRISLQPMTTGMSISNVSRTAGIYWVKLTSDGESITRKVVIK